MARPATLMNAGTSKALTTVASRRMAKATPNPRLLIFVTELDRNEAKTIAMSKAAAVMMRPVRCKPNATASDVVAPESCSSLILASMKTS